MSDLINRQDAIDAVGYYSLHSGDKLLFADKTLKELPSVQPRKGKWIGKEQFANSQEYFSWECDKCEWVLEDITLDKPYNFCPNCGADMRE